jgi:hypothetical protein
VEGGVFTLRATDEGPQWHFLSNSGKEDHQMVQAISVPADTLGTAPTASTSYEEGTLSFADLSTGGAVSFCKPPDEGDDFEGEEAEPVALHPCITQALQALQTLPTGEDLKEEGAKGPTSVDLADESITLEEEPVKGMDQLVSMLQGAQSSSSPTKWGESMQQFNMQKFLDLWDKEGPCTVELSGPIMKAAASQREEAAKSAKDYIERRSEFFQCYDPETEHYSAWSRELRQMVETGHYNPRQGLSVPDYDLVNQRTRKYIEAQKLLGTKHDLFAGKLYEEVPENHAKFNLAKFSGCRRPRASASSGDNREDTMGPVECVSWLLKVHTGEQRLIAGQWKKSTGSPDEPPPSMSWVRHVNQWPNDKVIQHLEGDRKSVV